MGSDSTPLPRLTGAALLLLMAGCALAPPSTPDAPARNSTAAALPEEGESWYSIGDGSQRYGAVHVVVRHRDDGGVEFRVESTAKIEFFGKQQEHGAMARLVVDRDLRPRELEATSTRASGRRAVRGEATEGGFAVTMERDGQTTRVVHSATDAVPLVCDAVLSVWLHGQAGTWRDGEAPRRVRILSTESGETTWAAVRRVPDGSAGSIWEIMADAAMAPTIVHLDGEGRVAKQVERFPPMRLLPCTQAEARTITHRRIPDRELLVFTPPGALPPAHRLERVTVELTWEGIPPDEFQLIDSRQRLASLVVEGARCIARVELERPREIVCRLALGVGLDAQEPASRPALTAALQESDFIKPMDPAIAAKAREIVGTETSTLAAGRAICRWVNEYIEPAMIAETLTGPEVLARRTGKCSEYTTLFASLARAAGIPTRVALGQRRFTTASGDSWGGHMWNEVYVGEWIPVDASANEVGGSTSLLKFVHADTVMATQPLRWKLTESLGMSIVDHAEIPRAAPGAAVATGLVDRTYTHAEHSFRLDLPGADWRVEATEQGNVTTLRIRAPKGSAGDSAALHLVVFAVPGEPAPRTILAGRLREHRAGMAGFQLVDDVPNDVAGARGHRIRFEGARKADAAQRLRVTEVIWIHEGQGFLMNLIASEEAHDAQAANLTAMLAAFEFLDR